MTTEAKEEMELLADVIAEQSSLIEDFQIAEEDVIDDFPKGTDEHRLTRFNMKQMKLIRHHLEAARTGLQDLIKQN